MYETLKSWYYKLFGNPPKTKKARKLLTREQVHEIEFIMFIDSRPYTQVELAIRYGVSTSVISKIYRCEHRYSIKPSGDSSEEPTDA